MADTRSAGDIIEVIGRGGRRPKLVIVLGKGGVGKTTVSILLARLLSSEGPTLVESLDQAMHLQEYLKLPKRNRVYEVRKGLYAKQFDVESEVRRLGDRYATLMSQIMPGLKVLNVESVTEMVKYAPGFEEEVYLRELMRLYREERYKFIVVDTPPTGLMLRILSLARLYSFWIDKLIELRERIVSLRYVIATTAGIRKEPDDPVLRKLLEMKKDFDELNRLLVDGDATSYVIVATPEPLPVYEARKTLEFLRNLGAEPAMIVANRILSEEMAEELGVAGVQERSVRELESLTCGRACARLYIPQVRTAPSSLEAVEELMEKVRVSLERPASS